MINEDWNKIEHLIDQQKYSEALESIKTQRDFRTNPECLYAMGYIYYKQNKLDDAIEYYRKTLEIDKNSIKTYINLAAIYGNKGNYEEAIYLYNKAIKLAPENMDLMYLMGYTQYLSKDYYNAIESLNRVIKSNQSKIKLDTVYSIRGFCYHELGDHKKTLEDCEKALNINEDSYYAALGKGVALISLGEIEKAIEQLKLLSNRKENDQYVLLNLGNCYEKIEKYDEAIKYYNECLTNDENFWPALLNKGIIESHEGNHQAALKNLNRAYKIERSEIKILISKGNVYVEIGDIKKDEKYYEKAKYFYEKALSINKKSFEAITNYGNLLSKMNKYYEAIKKFKESLEINNEAALTYLNMGYALYRVGLFNEAEEYYQMSLSKNYDKRPLYHGLMMLNRDKGNYEKAKEYAALLSQLDIINYKHIDSLCFDIDLIDYYDVMTTNNKKQIVGLLTKMDINISGNKKEKYNESLHYLLIKSQLYSMLKNYRKSYSIAAEYYRNYLISLNTNKRNNGSYKTHIKKLFLEKIPPSIHWWFILEENNSNKHIDKDLKSYINDLWQRKTNTPLQWWLYSSICETKILKVFKILIFYLLLFTNTVILVLNLNALMMSQISINTIIKFDFRFIYITSISLLLICLPLVKKLKIGPFEYELLKTDNIETPIFGDKLIQNISVEIERGNPPIKGEYTIHEQYNNN